ncbi:TPA_exp: hypothetical protein A8136_6286 [Trichophyton benhamiae CBS 112371]|nr:TPA_exp: hypothetical protein A8136_6286 [Trichophyton benhamiae CBS 112371]
MKLTEVGADADEVPALSGNLRVSLASSVLPPTNKHHLTTGTAAVTATVYSVPLTTTDRPSIPPGFQEVGAGRLGMLPNVPEEDPRIESLQLQRWPAWG